MICAALRKLEICGEIGPKNQPKYFLNWNAFARNYETRFYPQAKIAELFDHA
jgi:hypothetical protein